MSELKIIWNDAGFKALLKSPEITEACKQAAEGIKGRYGKDCKTSTHYGPNRVNVSVYSEKKDNGLLKALK